MTNIIKKNSEGYGYRYTDLAEIHRHMEEVDLRYYQEIDTVGDEDYIVTHILDATDKVIRKCRGCRVVKVSGKNPAQDYGIALTYARRYSLLLAFGLATADDDAAVLNPVETKPVRRKKSTDRPMAEAPRATPKAVGTRAMGAKTLAAKSTRSMDKAYRQAGVEAVKHLLDTGALELSEVQAEVRRYGADKMLDLPPDAFLKCVATLTQGRMTSA